MNEIIEKTKAEKDILSSFLRILTEKNSKKEALTECLNQIVKIPWLPILPKGGIFLTSEDTIDQIELYVTTENFSPQLLTLCNKVDFGYCICGRAASSKKTLFVDCIDDCHDTRFEGMTPHGHYSVPFLNNEGLLLGVLVLYVEHGHKSTPQEHEFLEMVANGLSSVYQRFHFEEENSIQKSYLLNQKTLLDQIVLVSETDINGKIVYANKRVCEVSGYSLNELIGEDHKIFNSGFHSKDFWKNVWNKITNKKKFVGEICNKAKDGSIYWIESTIFPILNSDGDIVGYSSIRLDVTERKKQELKQEEHNLKLSFLGKVATEIGHEINTPLGIIQMNAGLMKLKLSNIDSIDKSILKSLDNIETTVTRISEIVQGLKIIGRSSQNEIESINTFESISSIIGLIKGVFQQDKIKIILEDYNEQITFIGNQGHFHQVITNLLSNAKDALNDVTDSRRKIIKIYLRKENGQLIINIEDNADGISEEILPNIFEDNFTTKKFGDGTGIGLSLARNFIREMAGEILVETTKGKGSIFKIHLPFAESYEVKKTAPMDLHIELPNYAPTPNESQQDQKINSKILVVDDNIEMNNLLSFVISSFGCEVVSAFDGEEAFQVLETQNFDLMLTDLRMPNMSGQELLVAINDLNVSKMKIVVLSGELTPHIKRNMQIKLNKKVDIFLEKPITKDYIYTIFYELLLRDRSC